MPLPIDMKLVARKVHFLQNDRPNFGPVGNFRVLFPGVKCTAMCKCQLENGLSEKSPKCSHSLALTDRIINQSPQMSI